GSEWGWVEGRGGAACGGHSVAAARHDRGDAKPPASPGGARSGVLGSTESAEGRNDAASLFRALVHLFVLPRQEMTRAPSNGSARRDADGATDDFVESPAVCQLDDG